MNFNVLSLRLSRCLESTLAKRHGDTIDRQGCCRRNSSCLSGNVQGYLYFEHFQACYA